MSVYLRANKMPPVIGIIIGFLLYEFSTALLIFQGSDRFQKFIGLMVIVYFVLKSRKWKLSGVTNKLLIWLFSIEILMVIISIFWISFYYDPFNGSIRGFVSNLLFFTHSPLTFFIPLAAYLPLTSHDIKWLRNLTLIVVLIQLLVLIFNWQHVFFSDVIGRTSLVSKTGDFVSVRELVLSIFSGIGIVAFFLWNRVYLSKTHYLLFLSSVFLAFISSASGGGRGGSIILFSYLIVAIIINNSNAKFRIFKLITIASVFTFLLFYLYINTTVFSFLFQRLFTDDSYSSLKESSREYFTESMIKDFKTDPLSWIFGRGVYGAYRLPSGEYRQWMEWGYLYQVLKGGIIYLIAYVSILLYSFKKAIYNSNNILIKSMGFLCLLQVIELIPFGLPDMTAKYFIVWWFVGIISKREIREMSDNEIIQNFFKLRNYNNKRIP